VDFCRWDLRFILTDFKNLNIEFQHCCFSSTLNFQHWLIGSMLTKNFNVDSIGLILLNPHCQCLSTLNQFVNDGSSKLRSNNNVEIRCWGSKCPVRMNLNFPQRLLFKSF
jgi:hypothetical protein